MLAGAYLEYTKCFHFSVKQTRWPITTTAHSKARIFFDCSNTGIMGFNPNLGMNACHPS
jgi:hypothetical protein